jgi:enoyl-CoA hydratase/carnithine racemase
LVVKEEKKLKTIIAQKEPPVGRIILNRPEKLNAINMDLLIEIEDTLKEFQNDSEIKIIVIKSAIEKAFSAGTDIDFVSLPESVWKQREIPKQLHKTFLACRTCEKPIICAVDGHCLGAGLELAISCDFIIATNRSRFGLPNIKVGIPAIVEAAILIQAIGVMGARELALTGKSWDAEKAERRGLVNSVVPPEELDKEVQRWVDILSKYSNTVFATQKDIIHKWMTTDLDTAIDYSINTVLINFTTLDTKEGMAAFLEKRKAKFEDK